MSKIFKMPKNVIIPKARVEKAGEEVMSVAFDLGFETGDRPIAMVFENHNGKTYIRKLYISWAKFLWHYARGY